MKPSFFSQTLRGLGGVLLAAALVSCGDTVDIIRFSESLINTRLRPGLGSVKDVAEPTSMNDGGDKGEQMVSPLYFRAISPENLRQLRRSECFWVGSDSAPVISYELVLTDFSIVDQSVNLSEVGLCNFSDPETREPLRVDGERVVWESETGKPDLPAMGLLQYRQAGLTDPYDRCLDFGGTLVGQLNHTRVDLAAGVTMLDPEDASRVVLDVSKMDCRDPALSSTAYCRGRNVTLTDESCVHPLGTLRPAWCTLRCQIDAPEEDTTYGLEIVDRGTNLNAQVTGKVDGRKGTVPATLGHVKVVQTRSSSGVRHLARPLSFVRTANGLMSWKWETPDTPGGLWAENFSPQLKVARVRFFLEHPGEAGGPPRRENLVASRFPKQVVLDNGRVLPKPQCGRPDAETAELDLERCQGFFLTPSYLHSFLDAKLKWQVDFLAPNNMRPPLDQGDRIFIEFDLVGINQTIQGLSVSPARVDLGNVEVNEVHTFKDVLTLSNAGSSSLTIQRLWFEDRLQKEDRSGELTIAGLTPAFTPPFLLGPFSSVRITLAARLPQIEEKERWLVVEATSAGSRPTRIRAGVQARGVEAFLLVAPQLLGFHRTAQPQQPVIEYERTLLIENGGYVDLHRNGLLLEGDNAREFEVSASDCGHPSAFSSPAPASCRLGSGQAELIKVRYRPGSAGFHDAALRVVTDAGEKVVPLTAICGEIWGDSGGNTYTRACRY